MRSDKNTSLLFMILFFVCGSVCHGQSLLFDFESGTLQGDGWVIVEGSNSKPIGSRDTEFNSKTPYAKSGRYYITTLERASHPGPMDDNLCVLESPVFVVTGKTIRFLVGGGHHENTCVQLCEVSRDGKIKVVQSARGKNNERMDEAVWDTSALMGKPLLIRVVDRQTGSWGHIRCDRFQIQGKRDDATTALRRKFLAGEVVRLEAQRKQEVAAAGALVLKNLRDPILYVTRKQFRRDHHNTATLFQSGEINEKSFVGGSTMKIWYPATDRVVTLIDVPDGIVRDPTIHFSGEKVLFSIRRDASDEYHIAEMKLNPNAPAPPVTVTKADTRQSLAVKGITLLTTLPGVSDIDPIYLPNHDIMFSSTREPKYCMCNRHIMCNLYTMAPDGANIQQVGKSTLFEGHPSLLPDGRILYDRWEYVDRNFGDAQGIWVTNPDGTKHEIWWGNNTASPGGVLDARIVPDSDSLFVCTLGSCHDRPWGAIGLIDRRLGIDGRKPVLETWPPEAIELIDDSPHPQNDMLDVVLYDRFSRISRKFEDPWPLDETSLLASGMTGRGEESGIWYLQRGGHMTLIHEDSAGCYDPMPVCPTDTPRQIGSRLDLKAKTGTFYVTNVYEGMGMEKVVPGSIRFLRVVESPEKRFWSRQYWDLGNGTQAPAMAWNDFNNKRILGTVAVEDDGSVFFEVPAERFVYFQLLDADGTMIQSMRSGIMVRPGEMNGCVGCHESRLDAPASKNLSPRAMSGPPKKLQPWHGQTRLFSYLTEVQPVFDRYCLACHDVDKKGASRLLLCGDLNLLFNVSYTELRSKNMVTVPGAGPHVKLPAYRWGAKQSRLGRVLLQGHPDPKIDQERKALGLWLDKSTDSESFDRVMTWIDLNAPYYPDYSSAYPETRFGRAVLTQEEIKRLAELTGIEPVASHNTTAAGLDFAVWFSRPELSPCLARWNTAELRQTPQYREALELIRLGKSRIDKISRGEDKSAPLTSQADIDRQKRYEHLRKRELDVRKGIIENKRVYDWSL
ncbi:MAG: hypothetical protein PHQ75_03785 [Thermoguttaceae bacterium]|nr:hypothetical protein [Thermoguttaceae bacterium]